MMAEDSVRAVPSTSKAGTLPIGLTARYASFWEGIVRTSLNSAPASRSAALAMLK